MNTVSGIYFKISVYGMFDVILLLPPIRANEKTNTNSEVLWVFIESDAFLGIFSKNAKIALLVNSAIIMHGSSNSCHEVYQKYASCVNIADFLENAHFRNSSL